MEPVVYADIRKNWTGAGVLDLQNKKQKDKQKHLKKNKTNKNKKRGKTLATSKVSDLYQLLRGGGGGRWGYFKHERHWCRLYFIIFILLSHDTVNTTFPCALLYKEEEKKTIKILQPHQTHHKREYTLVNCIYHSGYEKTHQNITLL